METSLRLTKRYLVYGCATKSGSVKTNKKTSATQRGSKHDNTTTRGVGNQAQGRKKRTLTDSNYFYIEESIPCMKICARVTSFACTLHTRSKPYMQFVKA